MLGFPNQKLDSSRVMRSFHGDFEAILRKESPDTVPFQNIGTVGSRKGVQIDFAGKVVLRPDRYRIVFRMIGEDSPTNLLSALGNKSCVSLRMDSVTTVSDGVAAARVGDARTKATARITVTSLFMLIHALFLIISTFDRRELFRLGVPVSTIPIAWLPPSRRKTWHGRWQLPVSHS